MRMPLPMKLDHVNVYALDEGDSWTIVDTGFDSRKTRGIWAEIMDGPLQGKPISRVIVTHHHPDHIGLAGWFQSEHGAELWTTRTAWLMGRMLQLDTQEVATSETVAFWRSAGMDEEIIKQRASERPFNFSDVVAPMPLGYRRIKQGDTIRVGGRDWDVHMGLEPFGIALPSNSSISKDIPPVIAVASTSETLQDIPIEITRPLS